MAGRFVHRVVTVEYDPNLQGTMVGRSMLSIVGGISESC